MRGPDPHSGSRSTAASHSPIRRSSFPCLSFGFVISFCITVLQRRGKVYTNFGVSVNPERGVCMKKLGTRLETLRGEKTQKEFSALCGIPLNTYTNWVRGICEPSASALVKLCTTFGVSSDWLLGLSDERAGGSAAPTAKKIIAPQPDLLREIHELQKRVTALESSSQISTCA